jgi:hypothetical protein
VTCLPRDAPSWCSPSPLGSLHLPVEMHRMCSRNACSPLSFGLALHYIAQFASVCSTFRHSSFSPAPRLSHCIPQLPCWGPPKGLDGRPALSKKGAAGTADSPITTLASMIALSALRTRHVGDR